MILNSVDKIPIKLKEEDLLVIDIIKRLKIKLEMHQMEKQVENVDDEIIIESVRKHIKLHREKLKNTESHTKLF